MTIGDDGTWTEKVTFQTDQGPQSYTQIGYNNGTWTLTGGQLTIFSTKNNKTEYTGGFAKNELDLVFGSTLITFVR
jgi:hypothetical protein